jgi:hypothetical protein
MTETPWTKKADAPAFINAADAIRAVATGSPDAWVLPFTVLAPEINTTVDVAGMCALGPPPDAEFEASDFLGGWGLGAPGAAYVGATLGQKLWRWCYQRMFAAYCVQSTTGTLGCTPSTGVVSNDNYWRSYAVRSGAATAVIRNKNHGDLGGSMWSVNKDATGPIQPYTNITSSAWTASGPDLQITVMPGQNWLHLRPGSTNFVVEFCGGSGLVETPYDYTPVEQPASAVAPYCEPTHTLEQIGEALCKIESKLELIILNQFEEWKRHHAPLYANPPITVTSNQLLDWSERSTAFAVALSSIGSDVDMSFPTPRAIHRVGRVLVGDGQAWEAPIPITTSPMLVRRTHVGQTKIRIQSWDLAEIYVSFLYPRSTGQLIA